MSDRFWIWFLFAVACVDMFVGIVTNKHYLVTDGLILLVLSGILRLSEQIRDLERRDQ